MKAKIIVLSIVTAITMETVAALAYEAPSMGKANSEKAAAVQKYTCPMHPEVTSEKPGKCPKCGMNLVPVKS